MLLVLPFACGMQVRKLEYELPKRPPSRVLLRGFDSSGVGVQVVVPEHLVTIWDCGYSQPVCRCRSAVYPGRFPGTPLEETRIASCWSIRWDSHPGTWQGIPANSDFRFPGHKSPTNPYLDEEVDCGRNSSTSVKVHDLEPPTAWTG